MNKRKGISIIILVVTIIILIILSAATISIVTDEDLIDETEQVVTDLELQQVITAIKTEIRQYRLDKELEGQYEISNQEIIDIIGKYGSIQNVNGEQFLVNNDGKYKIKLSEIDPIFK